MGTALKIGTRKGVSVRVRPRLLSSSIWLRRSASSGRALRRADAAISKQFVDLFARLAVGFEREFARNRRMSEIFDAALAVASLASNLHEPVSGSFGAVLCDAFRVHVAACHAR